MNFLHSIFSCLDWFYCTLLRSGNPLAKSSDNKPRIPDQRFLPDGYLLPIDKTPTRDNLLHLIESNKMTFINGPPAIGKSIRVSFSFLFFIFPINSPFRSHNISMTIISINNGQSVFFIVARVVSPPMHYHHLNNLSIVLHSIICTNRFFWFILKTSCFFFD